MLCPCCQSRMCYECDECGYKAPVVENEFGRCVNIYEIADQYRRFEMRKKELRIKHPKWFEVAIHEQAAAEVFLGKPMGG